MKHLLWLLPVSLFLGCSREVSHAGDTAGRVSEDTVRKTPTLPNQYESEVDRNLTQIVRSALRNDTTLSTNAEKITVSTKDGTVTLRGVVASAAEKQSIVATVEKLAGVKECDDQLEVGAN
jgi:hyperosmotically inducible protein